MNMAPTHRRQSAELVSVVIPCYNQARFLGEAVQSVLAQTYPDVEIVVVDDGSTDNTSEIAAAYPGVRCIRQDNRGLSEARNTGLRYCLGSYLVFLDADDLLLPNALEIGHRALQADPACAFASGQHRLVYDTGSPPTTVVQVVERNQYPELLEWNYIGMHATVMYRRWVFDAVGGFDGSLPACEDYDLYLRIAQRYPVCCHDAIIADYRQHGANMSGNAALMLTSSLAVLRRHRACMVWNEQTRAAYEAGLRFWKECYGRPLAREVFDQARSGELVQATRGMAVLLRHYPRAFALGSRQLISCIRRRLRSGDLASLRM
jgi:glycosyltransferase involved in cell wall biosynthesis